MQIFLRELDQFLIIFIAIYPKAERNVLFVLLCFASVVARGNDGDVFTAQTEEGIEVSFKVINEAEKISRYWAKVDIFMYIFARYH